MGSTRQRAILDISERSTSSDKIELDAIDGEKEESSEGMGGMETGNGEDSSSSGRDGTEVGGGS